MSKSTFILGVVVLAVSLLASGANGALQFSPAAGWSVESVWSGTDVSHFAIEGGRLYVLGTEDAGGGQFQNVVTLIDSGGETEIARSNAFNQFEFSPDAITVMNGDVYWAHVQGFSSAEIQKTSFVGGTWSTETVVDLSQNLNVFSLVNDGSNVFGTGVGVGGSNQAFFLDDSDSHTVFADLPEFSGGAGFDPAGTFFAGAFSAGGDFLSHMYEFDTAQVADRVTGLRATPYASTDAVHDYVVSGNASAVMESDGPFLYGSEFNPTFTGSDPYRLNLLTGMQESLGDLLGEATAVTTDLYFANDSIYFLGKNDFGSGSQGTIFRLFPEPSSLALLAVACATMRGSAASRRRRGSKRQSESCRSS